MTDRPTFDAFEQRIAAELQRYVTPANDPRPAADIADTAMQPRGVVVRVRNSSQGRRFLVLGVAAVLLLPAIYLGVGGSRNVPALPAPSLPSPTVGATLAPTSSIPVISPAAQGAVSIFTRRSSGSVPGVSVFAVGPDGAETLVRQIPDSVLPAPGRLGVYGSVSEFGWLALGSENLGQSWPAIVVDLRDDQAPPWIITEASTGGIGPRWGPTGLLAAAASSDASAGVVTPAIVIADPATRTTRVISMHGGLIGGGPSILWAADGSGIVGSTDSGYQVVPVDGSAPRRGVGAIFQPRGFAGPNLDHLRVCAPGGECEAPADGRVERVEIYRSARTIWRPDGQDRAIDAGFGAGPEEYWLATSHGNGTQINVVRVRDTAVETLATINRGRQWESIGAPLEAPDHSVAVVGTLVGTAFESVVVPLDGGPATLHHAVFAGFTATAAIAAQTAGHSVAPGEPLPVVGQPYGLPSVEELTASQREFGAGGRVVARGSHDAVLGDTATHTYEIPRDEQGGGTVFFECSGPTGATFAIGTDAHVDPCLAAATGVSGIDPRSPIVVTATGDTSWRVILFTE